MPTEPEVTLEEDEPIVIELGTDDDADGDSALAQAQEKEKDIKSEKPDDAVESFKRQIEELKVVNEQNETRAQEAERVAAEALQYARQQERDAWNATQRQSQTEADMMQTGLAGAQSDLAAAKQAAKAAREVGDTDAEFEATARISRAANDIREYERASATLAEREEYNRRMAQAQRQQPQAQRQPTAQDIVNRFMQNPNILSSEKEWMNGHQDAMLDPKKNKRLEVAVDDALDQGLVRGSPAYFEHLNSFMGYDKQTRETMSGSRVSAPVSRSSSGTAQRPEKVKLTERDIEIAHSFGLRSPEQLKRYAANKLNVPNRQKELNGPDRNN